MSERNLRGYAKALGAHLRRVRHGLGLSLANVEEKSSGRWPAVVIGSYERADRAITVARLMELADFYGVELAELLPNMAAGPKPATRAEMVDEAHRLMRQAVEWMDLAAEAGEPS